MSLQSFNTNEGSIREFVSRLVTSILEASQSSRDNVQETIEKSKAERAISQNQNFKPFPPLDHVLDLGIISEEEVNAIMPTEALGDLDMSLGSFMGVSYKIFEATNRRPSDLVLMYVGINSKQASPGAWITYQPPSMRYVTVRSFRSQLTQRRTSLRFPNGTTYMREFTATR